MSRALAAALGLLSAAGVAACPFCAKLGNTVSDLVAAADAVVFGRFVPNPEHATGIAIEVVVKAPPGFRSGMVPLAREIAIAGAAPRLVFLRKRGEKYVVTRAAAQATRGTADYLAALAGCANRHDRVAACFARLLDPAPEIADDAYKSLAKLYAAELAVERSALDPEKLRTWLRRPDLKPDRAGLLALMLGLCGTPADADFLAAFAKNPPERLRSARDGFLGGLFAADFARGAEAALACLNDSAAPLADRNAGRSALAFALAELPRVDPAPLLARALPAAEDTRLRPDLLVLFRLQEFAAAEPLALRTLKEAPAAARIAAARYLAQRATPAARAALAEFRRAEPALAADAAQPPPFTPPPPRVGQRGATAHRP